MTKKKRLMVALSDEELKQVDKLKLVLHTKQLSKVVSFCLTLVGGFVFTND